MPYYKMLNKIVADTNYTQEQIVEQCEKLGKTISKSYLNKLLNNKQPPPKAEISRIISRVCNADERLLVIEGYLDKAPKEIKDVFFSLRDITMFSTLNMLQYHIDNKTFEYIKKIFENQPISDFIIELIENGNVYMDIEENAYELKSKDNNLIFNLLQPIGIKIEDDAMYPIIKKDDEIVIEVKNKYADRDILLVRFNNEKNVTARLAIFLGNDIKLIPINNKYESKLVNINDIEILGKVKKIITEI